jgi:putative solute:sodium symporter small subunit
VTDQRPDPPVPRVRVTSPYADRARSRPRPSAASEIDAQTDVGEIYVRALLRTQLRQAMGTLLALAGTIGLLPLAFHAFPVLTARQLFGMPLSWVLLAFGCYPVLVLLAWRYVRASERNEAEFVHVVERS